MKKICAVFQVLVAVFAFGTSVFAFDFSFVAESLPGIFDWRGKALAGDGSEGSPIVQIIWAGANGVIDPASEDGATTGDDVLLHALDGDLPFIRVGSGDVDGSLGQFSGAILHGLEAGSSVYARAWSSSDFDSSVAYGDSELRSIPVADGEIVDFGSWKLGTPVHYDRDSNGDSIPDGWCVLDGLDPFAAVEPLFAPLEGSMEVAAGVTGKNSDADKANDIVAPRRAIVAGDHVYIASRKAVTISGMVEIYSLDLQTRVGAVESVDAADGKPHSFDPASLAFDEVGGVLAVADIDRILFFDVDAVSGMLTYKRALPEYGTAGKPTDVGRFKDIRDIAYSADDGKFFVIDSKLVNGEDGQYYRVQSIDADLQAANVVAELPYAVDYFPQPPSAIAVANGMMFIANPGFGSIELYVPAEDIWISHDYFGDMVVPLQWPAGISCGEGGFLYVMERDAHRLRIMGESGETKVVYPFDQSVSGSYGAADGKFHSPEGVFAATGDMAGTYMALVADTGNNRVQWVNLQFDSDMDGMEDMWEVRNGLTVGVDDSMEDPDGDGLLNIGEFRDDCDPNNPDTNGNGGGDVWDMLVAVDPTQESDPVTPLKAVSFVVSPADTVFADGSNLVVTVTFNQPVDAGSNVTISFSDGIELDGETMTRVDETTYAFEYAVKATDNGGVDIAVNGAYDLEGRPSDPPTQSTSQLFLVENQDVPPLPPVDPFPITAFGTKPFFIEWEAVEGRTYEARSSATLDAADFTKVVFTGFVSPRTGIVGWTNDTYEVSSPEFFKVYCVESEQ